MSSKLGKVALYAGAALLGAYAVLQVYPVPLSLDVHKVEADAAKRVAAGVALGLLLVV